MPYPATPRTWVAGDVLTAAQLNAEIRDALLGAFPLGPPDGAWTAYTPTLVQGGTVTKTSTYAKYQRIGRTIFVNVYLACTGAGTGTNNVIIGLPVAAATTIQTIGAGWLLDSSAGFRYKGTVETTSTTSVIFRPTETTTTAALGATSFTAALASGDEINFFAVYEAAT